MATAKDNAIGLYLEGIRDGKPRDAMRKYTGDRYTQHSAGIADGPAGFIAFFQGFLDRNPQRDIHVIRALQDGPKVFLHVHQLLNGGQARWVTTDIFDSDADGRIIEHWDVIDREAPPNPSGRTQLDGPTEIVDRDRTDANKALVADFVRTCLIERQRDRLTDYIDPDRFHQHNPEVADGIEAFAEHFIDGTLSYQELFLLVGEGNFVATLNRARRDGRDLCRVDLFRVEDGQIVEHWDNSEPVPPREEWGNSGKF